MSAEALRQIESLLPHLTPAEREHLLKELATGPSPPTVAADPLYGSWKGKVPEDFDVEGAIREVRDAWKEELEEFHGPGAEEPPGG